MSRSSKKQTSDQLAVKHGNMRGHKRSASESDTALAHAGGYVWNQYKNAWDKVWEPVKSLTGAYAAAETMARAFTHQKVLPHTLRAIQYAADPEAWDYVIRPNINRLADRLHN
jgi:hypothetical protein